MSVTKSDDDRSVTEGRRNVLAYLSRDEIRALASASDLAGLFSLAGTWSLIAAAFGLIAVFPSAWWAWALGVTVLAGRQLALAVLMHDCAHFSLFRTRSWNDVLGTWLCAAPIWQRLDAYRAHHLAHHAHTSLVGDPDLGLTEPYPTERRALARKFARDLFGVTFARRVVATLLMDAGVLTYTASTGARRAARFPKPSSIARALIRNTGPFLLTNALLFASLAWLGVAELFFAWIAANATVYSVLLRLRAIAEHAGMQASEDPFRHTRTTRAGWLARLSVAPHHVNYHLEHHLLPTVPHYRLPDMHRRIVDRHGADPFAYAQSYLQVLRAVSTTPPQGSRTADPSQG
jgi:fatty acid desaturase